MAPSVMLGGLERAPHHHPTETISMIKTFISEFRTYPWWARWWCYLLPFAVSNYYLGWMGAVRSWATGLL